MFGGKFNRGPALTGLAASYLCPLLILLVGAALPYDGPPHPHWKEPPNWRMYVLYAPLVFHIALACGLLLFQKGRRVRAALVLIPGLWLSLCALFPAGINIVGVGP
jgi:hypothetical protein